MDTTPTKPPPMRPATAVPASREQVAEPRAHVPLRIFLSYGHDENENLVRRIKADLEHRGHDVWFDKTPDEEKGISPGADWRRSITDGILNSSRVVSFLSKHSIRDPGVCRDEIAIAIGVRGGNIQTILVESEQEVQPPVNIGHIQWLDMHDWRVAHGVVRIAGEKPAAGDSAWEDWYQDRLAEIVRVVESDESRRFAGEIETLNTHLKPIRSEARVCQLLSRGFHGRQWLFEAVENWRQDATQNSRLFWIVGVPGVGKSAFAAQLTHLRSDTVIAAQFCAWNMADHRDARRVVCSLAFQLATRLPDYRRLLLTLPEIAQLDTKSADELFDYLLANPLRLAIHGGRNRYLVVIDALDEAGEAGRNPLVEMLARNAQRLPNWLGLVVTSRPEFDVKTPFQALAPCLFDTESECNRADIRAYLRGELAPSLQGRSDVEALVERILDKSEGVFLFAERFCDDIRHGHLSLDRPDEFPQGLGGIFCQYFQRRFASQEVYEETVAPALGTILAAREPLPVEMLERLFGWSDAELRKWLRTFGSLFPVTRDGDHEVIRPYHRALAEWLGDAEKAGTYFASLPDGGRRLTEACWVEYTRGIATMSPYAVAHLPRHLADTQRWDDLLSMVMTPDSGLLGRWVDRGEGVDGLFCLAGLAEYLRTIPGQAIAAAAMATQIARIHSRQGDYAAAQSCLEQAADRTSWLHGRRIRAIALHELASLHLYHERFAQAASAYRSALLLCFLGVPLLRDEAAANLIGLGAVAIGRCRNCSARLLAVSAAGLTAYRRDGSHHRAAMRLAATACLPMGRYEECRRWLRRTGAFEPPTDIEQTRAWVLRGRLDFSEATLAGQQPHAAATAFDCARQSALRMHDVYSLIEAELGLAWCALAHGAADARHWLGEAERHLSDGSNFELWGWYRFLLAAREHHEASLDAFAAYASAEQFCRQHRVPGWQARALVGQGAIRWHEGNAAAAGALWDAARETAQQGGKGLTRLIGRNLERCRESPRIVPL